MRSSPTSPSRSRSTTSALALAALAGLAGAGCGDDAPVCGDDGAPAAGLTVTTPDGAITYGGLTGLLGNDCPDHSAPSGVVSLTIEGTQTDGPGLFTICVPRPDQLMAGPRSLGTALVPGDIHLIDVQGSAGACTFTLASTEAPSGAGSATGVCEDGVSPEGFALELDGMLVLRRTCGATVDTVTVTIAGRVAVGPR